MGKLRRNIGCQSLSVESLAGLSVKISKFLERVVHQEAPALRIAAGLELQRVNDRSIVGSTPLTLPEPALGAAAEELGTENIGMIAICVLASP